MITVGDAVIITLHIIMFFCTWYALATTAKPYKEISFIKNNKILLILVYVLGGFGLPLYLGVTVRAGLMSKMSDNYLADSIGTLTGIVLWMGLVWTLEEMERLRVRMEKYQQEIDKNR